MHKLTATEENIMQILWNLKKAFVKDIIAQMALPHPPYNTISSVVRILEKKGFITHKAYGKTHEYFPLVSKDEYRIFYVKDTLRNYFEDSFQQMVSFFAKKEKMDVKELESMIEKIKNEKKGPHE